MAQQRGIPETIIEEIKQRNEIVSVVEQYVKLDKKSSQNLFGLCPFHSEDTPSFSVSPGKQIFYCFGCHKGGDVIHFIMDIEKVGYLDALKILAEKARIEIPASTDQDYQKKIELAKKLYAANTEAARYFYMNLLGTQGAGARDYLKKRGIDSGTAKRFGLGYAIDDWNGLYRHLRTKGYPDDIIFLTGLFKRRPGTQGNENSTGMYDLFRNRLMFPIFDYLGKIVAFGGRVMDDSMPKYINSPETPIYTKGRHLYGFQIAKSSKSPQLVVVEGYMDAIAMHQAGIDNAVASLGTALTDHQATLIRKHSENTVIAYDSDAAGQTATLRGLEILTRKGCKVSVLCLPEGKDPDEYIKKNGPERFTALLKDAMPLMDYKLWSASNAAMKDGAFDRIIYQDLACNILAQEENKIIRELYAMKVAEKLGVPLDPVISEIERRIRMKSGEHTNNSNAPRKKIIQEEEPVEEIPEEAKATKDELRFLCLISTDPRIYPAIQPPPELEYFSAGMMQFIAKAIFVLAAEKKLTSSSLVEIGGDNMVNKRKLSELFANGCMKIGEDINIKDAIVEARILYINMQIEKFKQQKNFILKSGNNHINLDFTSLSEDNKETLRILDKKLTALKCNKEQINTSY